MSSGFTGREVYEAEFEPRAYLSYFSFGDNELGDDFLRFVLPHYSRAFAPGRLKGDLLIDVGSGPTVYQLLSACEAFREIVATDYTAQNRQELQKWLSKEPDAFDWSPVVKYVCELEGDREKWAEKEETLRAAIRRVLPCDVLRPRPLDPAVLPLADCLVSSLCLEAACRDLTSYRLALRHISGLLKPGGHLVLSGDLGVSFYMVGAKRFSALPLEEGFLREALAEAGYFIETMETALRTAAPEFDDSDYKGMYFIVARLSN
ncbi:nicotinamide N-methyltransferase-like [Ornithorhynchus anatinus]|uniref:nicotinamide N-methyltransferase-like n=1 Tax=Ornithorhynchus anatinus TaxID=9258 RepID=UPI0010A80E5C|nr:nicotinamide N-methyltransferase-like [Ornithorhynchus anatinus]